MRKVYHISIDQELDARLRAILPKSMPKTTAIRALLERQIDFEERKATKPWKATPSPSQPITQPYQQDSNDLIVEPFYD